jgi:energy-coupling factor transporter transmembrane protein EcfT
MKNSIPEFLLHTPPQIQEPHEGVIHGLSYIDKGIKSLSEIITTGFFQGEQGTEKGLFRKLDARVKVLFLIFFVVIISLKRNIFPEVIISVFTFLLVAISRVHLFRFYQKVIGLTFLFGFLVAFPSAFNVVTPGEMIFPVVTLQQPYHFWIYLIPQQIGITRQGSEGVTMLCLRIMNSLTISLLVIHTTSFHRFIKALQVFRVPGAFLLIITLSYKYIFIFAKTVENMYLARKSRQVGMVRNEEARIWIAGRMAHMFRKTMSRYDEMYRAMVARGFAEEVKLSGFGPLTLLDRLSCGFFFLIGIILLWI